MSKEGKKYTTVTQWDFSSFDHITADDLQLLEPKVTLSAAEYYMSTCVTRSKEGWNPL